MSLQIFLYLETTAKVRRSGLNNSYILQPPVKPNSYPSCHYSVSYYNRTCGSKSELNAADYTKQKVKCQLLSYPVDVLHLWYDLTRSHLKELGCGIQTASAFTGWLVQSDTALGIPALFFFFSPCMLVSPQCPPSCRNKDRLCCSWHFSL